MTPSVSVTSLNIELAYCPCIKVQLFASLITCLTHLIIPASKIYDWLTGLSSSMLWFLYLVNT
jgi:hypothetical protein